MIDVSRGVLLAGAGALLLSWMATAGTSQAPAPLRPAPPVPAAEDPAVRHLQSETERLRVRLERAPVPREPARNPFRYGDNPAAAAVPRESAATAPPAPAVPAAPLPVLIGLAEDASPAGPVRTAILSVPGDLLLVRVGDRVMERFRVGSIGHEGIELTDITGGPPVRLFLR